MSDVAIISAIYGNYDIVNPPLLQDNVDVDWVLVTDNLELKLEYDFIKPTYGNQQWRIVYDPRPDEKPFRAAKHAKFTPWKYTDAPASIWIDGSIRVIAPWFASDALELVRAPHSPPIAAAPHAERDCLYPEAEVSTYLKKYVGEPLLQQSAHYQAQGHPAHAGLWFTTTLVRRHTEAVRAMSEAWEQETYTWSSQDQVSFPYVVRQHDLKVACMHAMPARWGLLQGFSATHNAANDCNPKYAYSHRHPEDCQCEVCNGVLRLLVSA